MIIKAVVPVIHEFGAYLFVPDLELYHSFINYYLCNVEDRFNHYISDRHGRKFKFWSKPGGLRNPKTNELAFEYIFSWKDDIGASKCHIVVKPLFGLGTKTKTDKTYNLPEIGTNIEVQCSYLELHDILNIYEDILKAIGATRFEHSVDYKRSRIFHMARHVRYHERHEAEVVYMLKAIKNNSSMRGDVDLVEKVRSGKYDMYKVDLPSFDVCNIKTDFVHSVKSYRIKNFLERNASDPLKHPKLEVFLNSKEQKRIHGKYPTIDEFLQIERDLDMLLASLLNFVGPIEYISDAYFDADKTKEIHYHLPQWDYRRITTDPDIELPDNNVSLKMLGYIAFQREGYAEVSDIIEATGIPERSVWRYINQYKEDMILDTRREKTTKVFFRKTSVWEQIKEGLIKLSRHLKFGFKHRYGAIFFDGSIILSRRKNKKVPKETKPIVQYDDEPIEVYTFTEADKISAYLRKHGIKRKVRVISTGRNKRFSRVKH